MEFHCGVPLRALRRDTRRGHMGYPMTWKRVINRNHLGEGDYDSLPSSWRANVNLHEHGMLPEGAFIQALGPHWVARIEAYERSASLLLGDLRRLEQDTLDECEICSVIAARTLIDRNVVAAVLKEYLSL